jgi:hypothetical protein
MLIRKQKAVSTDNLKTDLEVPKDNKSLSNQNETTVKNMVIIFEN